MSRTSTRIALRRGAGLALVAAVLAGCAAADKTQPSSSSASGGATGSSGMAGMPGMSTGAGSSTAGGGGAGSGSAPAAYGGIKPVPTQMLAQTSWQGMRIRAMATTAVPFVIYDGTSEKMVKPPAHVSFHLMVELSDAQTGVAIPYATVWATIARAGKIVYDERQWPMISRYMGPHYGNDVSLPGGGTYRLSLLISPPVSARHVEYQKVWLEPHRVTLTFHWRPPA